MWWTGWIRLWSNEVQYFLSIIYIIPLLTIGLTKHYWQTKSPSSILHGVRKLQRTEAALKTPSVTIMSSHTLLFVLIITIIIIIITIIILSPLLPPWYTLNATQQASLWHHSTPPIVCLSPPSSQSGTTEKKSHFLLPSLVIWSTLQCIKKCSPKF